MRALQALTGGPSIEVNAQNVDGVNGTYRLHLPVAAPVKAAFASGAPLVFAPDATAAGKYTIQANAPDRLPQDKPANISGGTGQSVNFNYGP